MRFIFGVYSEVCDAELTDSLPGTVRRDEASDVNISLGAGAAEAGGLEVRPGLLRAIAADRLDIEPVGFGQRLRHTGFDCRRKAGQEGKGCSNTRSDSNR